VAVTTQTLMGRLRSPFTILVEGPVLLLFMLFSDV
jgi:hypothetical protein